MSDEQCGADPFENGYDEKLSEKEYRERIKYLMRCHDDSADEIERLRAEKEQLLNGYDQILDHLSDAVQSDCENGVRVLNEIAAKNYLKEYPETRAAFHAIGKIARAALAEQE
jgi:hypothetical protein